MIAHDRRIAENTASNRQRLYGNTFQRSSAIIWKHFPAIGRLSAIIWEYFSAIGRSSAIIWKPKALYTDFVVELHNQHVLSIMVGISC